MLRTSARAAYLHRWTGILAVAAQRALTATLLELRVDEAAMDGEPPPLEDVLLDARLVEPPMPSRVV